MQKRRFLLAGGPSRLRAFANAAVAGGFFLLCSALPSEQALLRGLPGAGLMMLGGLGKLLFWRCPHCGCHLALCLRGKGASCPCCGAFLGESGDCNFGKKRV